MKAGSLSDRILSVGRLPSSSNYTDIGWKSHDISFAECSVNILIFNCGSSSQLFKVYESTDEQTFRVIASGKARNVATQTQAEPQIDWSIAGRSGSKKVELNSHRQAAKENLKLLVENSIGIDAIGHHFVHGGEYFTRTAALTNANLELLKKCFPLAPLHNPNSYSVIEVCWDQLPDIPQFAVFDTAFHARLPEEALRYALPRELALKYGFRKYGFHGLSCAYVSGRAADLLEKPLSAVKLILCHLGTGGSSVTAFKDGHSIDNSMGYSPLAGLVMSTRCGDIDAEIVLELLRLGMDADAIERMLNQDSGLIGLSGFSSNLAEVIEEGEKGSVDCHIAAEVYAKRLQLYIGGYYWQMNGVDAIVFTDSIGTGSWKLREKIAGGVESLGIRLDHEKNRLANPSAETFINRPESAAQILVIPTDEEQVILQEVIKTFDN